MMGYGGFGGMGWGGMVGMVLLWAVLIGLVVWAVTRLLPTRPNGGGMQPGPETPEEILDRRFGVFPKKWRRSLCREFVDVSES